MSAKSTERDTAKHNVSPDGQTHSPKNICPESDQDFSPGFFCKGPGSMYIF